MEPLATIPADLKIAHISEDGTRVQTVEEHCRNTAALAESYAAAFGSGAMGRTAGLLHDLGKSSTLFQQRIRGCNVRVDHSTAGAQIAWRELRCPQLAFVIAGHHGGLPDSGSPADRGDEATLFGRMAKQIPPCGAPPQLAAAAPPAGQNADPISQAFYTHMLYSCLVDADYLDTETFMQGTPAPRGQYADIPELERRLRQYIAPWQPAKTELNERRCEILRACIEAGQTEAPGLFTLTVPTGGGKTVASLAFALEMAKARGLSRVIYVIPYTSIIDQNAQVFAEILGPENVIEHHSGADFSMAEDTVSPAAYRKALATENWDAPVIVTTAVQFFESIYASKSSRCRKLHNLAKSVIIFDEAQTLPSGYLRPCLSAILQLVQHYCAAAVLCTATQPALEGLADKMAPGISLREICPAQEQFYRQFRRTEIRQLGPLTEEALSGRLSAASQVLCVVNRRKTAQSLYHALPGEGNYCLTTLLYPAHRKALLKEIRARLLAGKPCRVVSTSLIEAGVDVDFPTAYREEAGLDSILQTAGRCNREGLRDTAQSPVFVFSLPEGVPAMLRQQVDAARIVMHTFADPASPQAVEKYFTLYRALLGEEAQDKSHILQRITGEFDGFPFPFATVAEEFHLIDTPTRTLYIPMDAAIPLVEELRQGRYNRRLYRALGQYGVAVYPPHFEKLQAVGAVETLEDGSAIMSDLSLYHPQTGLALDVESGKGIFL